MVETQTFGQIVRLWSIFDLLGRKFTWLQARRLQVQEIFTTQHKLRFLCLPSLRSRPLFLKNPFVSSIPTLLDLALRPNRPRDIVQALHDSFHLENSTLEVAYRPFLVESGGRGELLLEFNRLLEEFTGSSIRLYLGRAINTVTHLCCWTASISSSRPLLSSVVIRFLDSFFLDSTNPPITSKHTRM